MLQKRRVIARVQMDSKLDFCAECKRKCLPTHLKTRSSPSFVSSFFKVMIRERDCEVLFLPPKFAPTVSSLIDKEVSLEDSNGLQWKVKLTTVKNSVALNQGWDIFAVDHGLELGDFVMFHYILGSHFLVQIFDKTCCEKHDFPNNLNRNRRDQVDKFSTNKHEPKSSVLSKSKPETGNCQFKTSEKLYYTPEVSEADISKEPRFLINRKGKGKVNDSVNVTMGSSNKNPLPRPQSVCKTRVIKEPDGKNAEYQTVNPDTSRINNFGGRKMEGAKGFPCKADTFCYSKNQATEKAKSRKKPKEEHEQDDPISISTIGYTDKSGKKVKLEALNIEALPLTIAGNISCLIESNGAFLKLPAALPSSSSYKRTTGSSKRMVLLKGPNMKWCRVEYHETPEAKVLKGGWEEFCKLNNILPGDECTFEAENETEDIFRVTVVTCL